MKKFYRDIKKYSNETWRYGHKTILNKYTFTGTKNAWQSDLATASQRTQKRVFGWWLAYPWGVFEATTESVLRLATGIPVGVAVSASAYTVVPAITMAWPVVESAGFASIQGVAYPLVASAWNTVVAPPLALLGQQPAPQRADGFWMKQVDDPNLQALAEVVIKWQRQLALNNTNNETVETKDKKASNKYEKGTVYIFKTPKNKLGLNKWSVAFVPTLNDNKLNTDVIVLRSNELYNETLTEKEIENEDEESKL